MSVCATCDAFFYKGKKVVVVGGGDTAMGEAAFIARFAREVMVVHRGGNPAGRAVPMQERARKNKRVSFRLHHHADRDSGRQAKWCARRAV